jgi:predicted histone-like DNA-binding protein
MAIFYRKVQNNRTASSTFGQWYGRAVILDVVSTKELAEEISHATTVTYADVLAVLTETSVFMKKHLQNSQKVVLDGIGSFRVGLKTKPAETSAEFDSSKIAGYHIVYSPERNFNVTGVNDKGNRTGFYVKKLLEGVTAKEAPKNDVKDEPKNIAKDE